jgi:hypothetical protein
MKDLARRGVLCSVITSYNVAVVCIQETKVQAIHLSIVNQCCGSQFTEFCYAPADGTRRGRGILLVWKPEEFHLTSHFISPWFISAYGCLIKTETPLSIVSVYGPHTDGDKLQLQFLQSFSARINLIVQASDTKQPQNHGCLWRLYQQPSPARPVPKWHKVHLEQQAKCCSYGEARQSSILMDDGMQLFLTACYMPCPLKCPTTALCSSLQCQLQTNAKIQV